MNQKPIFILGAHKSGTSLLRSILDGHSQLYALPIETHYFELKGYWVDYEYRRQRPQKISREQIIDTFCHWIHTCNTTADPYVDAIAKGIFDEYKFREYFSKIQHIDDDKETIERYFEAIYFSVTGKHLPIQKRIVEKSVENAEFALELRHFFPEAKFIHIIRNPYANIVSLRKFKSIEFGFPLMPRILRSLYNNFYYLYKNRNIIENYLIIKYENLVQNPEYYIKKICKFLEIPFEEILLTPTHQGRPWYGNSITGQKFSSIVQKRIDKWKDEILPLEVFYINKIFPFVLEDFEYKKFQMRGKFWSPAKGESIKRFLYNRIFRFYI